MAWVFHESDPMGGAAGEAYANTLKSPGMPQEHVLAREAIQNSVDAGVGSPKVTVKFRQRILRGDDKTGFVAAAGLQEQVARTKALDLTSPNCLSRIDDRKHPLEVLYVEDYDAEGLSGDPHDKSSNFYRLLLSLGDRSKARTMRGTGGSYGFGKSVYSSSSAIQTIFAYTRFVDTHGRETTRLFGCGYYKSHEYRRKSFSGRAWLGTGRREDPQGRTIVDPIEGRKADNLAGKLGFEPRHDGQIGTTILIVDAAVKLPVIVGGVEEWWWPRLVEQKLDVEIIDATGQISIPRPRRNEQLKPFIEAFEIARGVSVAKSGSQKLNPLNRFGDMNLGVCGFTVAPLDTQGAPTVRADRCNSVALIRAPLMVVAYRSFSELPPVVVGAFMAADDIDTILKKSEPPAHDRWDPDSVNLRDDEDSAKETVKAVLARVKGGLQRFQREAAPPPPPKQRRLSILERALGAYFRPTGAGPGGAPEPTHSLIHLEFAKQPHAVATPDGMLRLRASFNVTLDPQAGSDEVALRLRIGCPVLEDDGEEGEDLALTITAAGIATRTPPDDTHVRQFTLAKGAKARFDVESEAYDPAWTVRLRPDIDEEAVT